ncbi:hypothetical protein SAMN05421676_105128 [Salinibacillus kushneri]|uniref:Uncharacterized protein n=1 Tax=Salinibacillus kushneri TaxID=237682 RepID=A0A1I0EYG4_9BACI|nr:hypothetical protein [Salinibacillus kushneri]SET50575.1 hypothetical protein SAMN05421676_105128 [Salinibacillus kushneri]
MYISFKSIIISFIGTSIGFTLVAIGQGLWSHSFDWGQWIGMLIGGAVAHALITTLVYMNHRRNNGR